MRALFAIALSISALAAAMPARAADLVERGVAPYGVWVGGARSGQVVIYDTEPGVLVRAYWLRPWRNHHYFAATGHKPRVGRLEKLSAPRSRQQLAEPFYQSWSTNELFPRPLAPMYFRPPVPDGEGVGPVAPEGK
jgi:hypothetical protein